MLFKVQRTMFDKPEDTMSGKDWSHDTLLVIFQNQLRGNHFEDIQMTDYSDQREMRKLLYLPASLLRRV